MTAKFSALIADDPVAGRVVAGCATAEQAARAARVQADAGEIITIIGPRGGESRWEAVGSGATSSVRRC